MSKPRIFGHCAAGCEWQVPHMSDFKKYAAMTVKLPVPEIIEGNKLPSEGYYYITISIDDGSHYFSMGVVYFKPNSGTFASCNGYDLEIYADGRCYVKSYSDALIKVARLVESDLTYSDDE